MQSSITFICCCAILVHPESHNRVCFSPSSMALYLLEPHVCEYVLGVETSIVCPLLERADPLGLLKPTLDSASSAGGVADSASQVSLCVWTCYLVVYSEFEFVL